MLQDAVNGKESVRMEQVALEKLSPGDHGTVAALRGLSARARQRLLEMGVTSGTHLQFVRRAPFGDPIEINMHGYRLMLRCTEAQGIFVFPEKDI
jgi:Fe2+ transport system protein FeoA